MPLRLPSGLLRSFASLKHRNYRLLWTGTLVSQSGDWMDQVALNWYVLQLTGSPVYLGLVNLCRGLPILVFTLIGGALADRIERRRLMVMTQSAAMVLAFILAALVISGVANVWMVMVVATLRGTVVSVNLPTRHSLISELVPRTELPNAIALNSVTVNICKVVGPMLGGIIIARWGSGACFLVNGFTFSAALAALLLMRFPAGRPAPAKESLLQSLVTGFRFVRGDELIRMLILIAMVPTLFGQQYIAMLAVYADGVFDIGATGLGLLTAAACLGAVAGSLLVAALGSSAGRGDAMLGYLLFFGVLLFIFAVNPSVSTAPFILFGVGFMQLAYTVSNNVILQMVVPDAFRGRVLSTLFLNRGLVSIGTAIVGGLAAWIGIRAATATMAALIMIFTIAVILRSPRIRSLRT